jgi:clan AA aspartic protease (TIGR02281 family)
VRYSWGFVASVLALGLIAKLAGAQAGQPTPAALLQQYRLAAAQGDPAGLDGLGTLFERGSGVTVDFAKAYALYHLAASRQSAGPALVSRATQHRDFLGARMSSTQLARVNDLIALCNGSDVNRCGEIIISAGAPSAVIASAQAPTGGVRTSSDGKTIIPLEPANGIYAVPGVINGVMTVKFAVDTGAADVSIPADIVKMLVDAGFIAQDDFLGERNYRIANGSTMRSQTFRIRSLQIGDVLIENVDASVVPEKAPILLGQSFLSRLKSWSMDTTARVLVIE